VSTGYLNPTARADVFLPEDYAERLSESSKYL
jgi:hypothetical protein